MEEMKVRLPRLERSVDQLTQHMAKMMQTMEDTQKAVSTLIHQKADSSRKTEVVDSAVSRVNQYL